MNASPNVRDIAPTLLGPLREEIPAQYLDSAFQAESTLLAPRGERCEELVDVVGRHSALLR